MTGTAFYYPARLKANKTDVGQDAFGRGELHVELIVSLLSCMFLLTRNVNLDCMNNKRKEYSAGIMLQKTYDCWC